VPQPPSLRETLREHQLATDSDDTTMLTVLCDALDDHPEALEVLLPSLLDGVVDRLSRGPGDVS
jgi:hypothetical protein